MEQILKEYHEYIDVFNENKADRFPESWPWDHKIELKEGFQPKSFKTYNLTLEEQKELDNWTKDNLDKGYIWPSQSPMASPFFYVKKKDGKLQPCRAKYFTKLNVQWGYNNIQIRDGDQWKAAFKMNKGLFKPTVMFFWTCNSPATFQSKFNDGHHFQRPDWCRNRYHLYGWHIPLCMRPEITWRKHPTSSSVITKEWSLFETKEMQICQNKNRMVRHDHWRRTNFYGCRKIKGNMRLADSNFHKKS